MEDEEQKIKKMKTLRSIGMALLAVILCVSFATCSDDDDESSTLAGTTWKIITTDEEDMEGVTFTFNENKTVTVNPSIWSKVTWSVSDNDLKIVFQDDDYIQGTISINGNSAAYQYMWYDVNGEWGGEESHSMTLEKQ